MLNIAINPEGLAKLNFAGFKNLGLPGPPNGADEEINGDLILKFEDEAEAITYAQQLEDLSTDLNDKSSPENLAIGEIIVSINNDEFVRNYSYQQA